MYFLIEDGDLLKKKKNTIPDDVRLITKRNLTASLCMIKNYLKTKIKDPTCTCLGVITLDSALKKDANILRKIRYTF